MADHRDRIFSAFLFDMDGTIVDSLAVVNRVWTQWARRHGVEVEPFLRTMHGIRAAENIRRLELPGLDVEREVAAVTLAELADVDGIRAIAGAAGFLHALPTNRWAVVTSATRELALRRLRAAGLPLPAVLVTADDVDNGKPAPDCFRLAAKRLGVAVEECLVFEDAPAGIRAAEAAGAAVVVVTAAHSHPFETNHPTISGYGLLRPAREGEAGLRLAAAP